MLLPLTTFYVTTEFFEVMTSKFGSVCSKSQRRYVN